MKNPPAPIPSVVLPRARLMPLGHPPLISNRGVRCGNVLGTSKEYPLSQYLPVFCPSPAGSRFLLLMVLPLTQTPTLTRPQSLLCCARNGGGGTAALDSNYDIPSNSVDNTKGGGAGGATHCGFSETEECLWLRVFSAVERYAKPCRTEPRQGPTPPHLVPLEIAVSSVEEIFGGERDTAATNPPKTNTSKRRCVGGTRDPLV